MYLHRESKGYINACKVQEKLMNKKIFSFPKSKIRKKIHYKLEEEYKQLFSKPEAKFKEFEPRLKFKPRLKYGWDNLKLNAIFQDLSSRSIKTGF